MLSGILLILAYQGPHSHGPVWSEPKYRASAFDDDAAGPCTAVPFSARKNIRNARARERGMCVYAMHAILTAPTAVVSTVYSVCVVTLVMLAHHL